MIITFGGRPAGRRGVHGQPSELPSWYSESANTLVELESFGSLWDSDAVVNPSHHGGSVQDPVSLAQYEDRFSAWSGVALIYKGGRPYLCSFGGGHAAYGMNDIVLFGPLDSDTPGYSAEPTFTAADSGDVNFDGSYYNDDGLPGTFHSYSQLQGRGSNHSELWITKGGQYASSTGNGSGPTDRYDFATQQWDAAGTWPDVVRDTNTGNWVYHSGRDLFYMKEVNALSLQSFDPSTGQWATVSSYEGPDVPFNYACDISEDRDEMYTFKGNTDICRIDLTSGNGTAISAESEMPASSSIVYAKAIDSLVVPVDGSADVHIYDLTAESWSNPTFTFSGTTLPAFADSNDNNNGLFGRWRYVHELKAAFLWCRVDYNVYFYRFA